MGASLTWDTSRKTIRGCLECEVLTSQEDPQEYNRPLGLMKREMPPIKIIGLTDSANAYASVTNLQPRSADKLTRITLAFLRDLTSRVAYSFIDAHLNIADCGAKRNVNLGIF